MKRLANKISSFAVLACVLAGCGSQELADSNSVTSQKLSALETRGESNTAISTDEGTKQVLDKGPAAASCGGPILFPCNSALPVCNVMCCSGAIRANPDAVCGGCEAWGNKICGSGLYAAWWSN